jgi:hydroxymethylbilane synthase
MSKTVRIGTRDSRLAVIQAELVADAIRKHHPEIEARLVPMKTTGDQLLDKTLDQIGGKGLFVKELDDALLRGDVDICVHSYKDVPVDDNPDLPIVATSPREDPRDVLILPEEADSVDPNIPIGCSSKRRQIQLAAIFPRQAVAPVRGNVLTRLEKLDRGEFSALVLAAAGIKRLCLWDRVSRAFSVDEILPAGCQGILAIQARRGEDHSFLLEYNDRDALDASLAERAFIKRLDCGCGAPIGVFGEINGNELKLRGMIAVDSENIVYDAISGDRRDAAVLGTSLAEKLIRQGGVI